MSVNSMTDVRVSRVLDFERNCFKVTELKNDCERQVARQLARQTEVHLASLREIETQRAAQLRAQYSEELEKTVRAAKEKNAASLKEMQDELRTLDELFKGNLPNERLSS